MLTPLTFQALRRALFLVLPLALLPTLSGCGTQAQNAINVQNMLLEAERHAQVDLDDKQARVWADRAVAVAPHDPDTYVGAREASPVEPLLNISVVFAEVGDDAALADYMGQAATKFPDNYRPLQLLAVAQGRLGREAERKATATKLAALLTKKLATPGAQDIEDLTLARAQAYWDAGDAASGTAEGQKAIHAYPADPTPLNNLAYAYAVANVNLPQALALAQQALALARKKNADELNLATYQDTLGWVQHRLGDDKDAEQNLQEAASTYPRLPEVRYHLGTVYAAEGKTDAARSEFGHAVLLAKDYLAAKQALATLPKSTASASS